ncbi:MAG TPA: S8 family serine peptidase [Pyrinomonadaceae bacterium]|nr:S8 family serine peptidase [Pyrinomonadaceae bacterium]
MLVKTLAVVIVTIAASVSALTAPSVDRLLAARINASPLALTPVVITFNQSVTSNDFLMLQSLGIRGGYYTKALPIVLTSINRTQFNALKTKPGVRSLYANRTFRLLDLEGRTITGVENLIRDTQVTALNNGLPVTGKNIGVSYIDTGIDATHPDLKDNVAQNVYYATADLPVEPPAGFLPVVPVENVPITDIEGGHGTFGAGVTAGTGAASAGLYTGMAPGAKLIGIRAGNDVGLTTYAIVQAMDYTLVNQFRYNIRVCNNSWGTTLADNPYDPNDPINTATRMMHDRNITVVFAAGNDGDAPDMINPFSVAPWVISVAAAEKQGLGTPAGFSSRGNDNGTGSDTAGQPADSEVAPNLRPDITGSGVDIKSTRSKAPGVTNLAGTIPIFVGANDLSTIPPAYLPYYTTSQGTSFSTPQVSGIVALMLEANPLLTPDQVVTLLRQTATPMPYEERVVGAGYVDAHNAVRAAMSLAAVPHPANLFPSDDPNAPQIVDPQDDQLGTTAQDIRAAFFRYDPVANQIVYRLRVTDASVRTPNMRWTLTSAFGAVEVFVTASVDETAVTYEYGKITTLATGTQNQETIGAADFGSIDGNEITIKLGLAKVNAAVGSDVLGTTSTNTQAEAQILIGSSLSGGLLLNADSGTGSSFDVAPNDPDPTPTPTPSPTPTATPTPSPAPTPGGGNDGKGNDDDFKERYSGTIQPGQSSVEIPFSLRRSGLDAQINQNHGNQKISFELLDANGNVIVIAENDKIELRTLATGNYVFRIRGSVTKAVDFTVKSEQGE